MLAVLYRVRILRKAASEITPIPKVNPAKVIADVADKTRKELSRVFQLCFHVDNGAYLSGGTDDTGCCKIIIETQRAYDSINRLHKTTYV